MSKIYLPFHKLQYETSWKSARQIEPKLWPTRKIAKNCFHSCDLDLDPMTLIYELDLDIMEMYLYAKNEVPSSKHSKVIARTDGQTDRQTDRQTDTHTHTHTQTLLKTLPNRTRVVIRDSFKSKTTWEGLLQARKK